MLHLSCSIDEGKKSIVNTAPIRAKVAQLLDEGRTSHLITYLKGIETEYQTLLLDNVLPPLYYFLGSALRVSQKLDEAAEVFKIVISNCPNDSRAWINLGDIQAQNFELMSAIASFEHAYHAGETAALSRIVRTKGWSISWENMDKYSSKLEKTTRNCYTGMKYCPIDSTGGFQYTDISGTIYKFIIENALKHTASSAMFVAPFLDSRGKDWFQAYRNSVSVVERKKPRMKVGFISSDFGIHPVATLVRGMMQYLDKSKFEIYCFSIQPGESWWGRNISQQVEHFINLNSQKQHKHNAEIVAYHKINILIDLNGHTLNSGLPIMEYRAAPIQISFLGLPSTTAAPFIDYVIGDFVSLPPEHMEHFTEKTILMNTCYIVNDYAQTQGAVAYTDYNYRAPRLSLSNGIHLDRLYSAQILLATLSNSMKIDPSIFQVWMNIMQSFPGSKMIFLEHVGHETFFANIVKEAAYRGIPKHRLISLPLMSWIDHLLSKSAIDLVLDTVVKNSHTTGLDGLWAGVPTVTLAGGNTMEARAGESIAHTLENELGVTFSLKDYEDLTISLMKNINRSKDNQKRSKRQRYLEAIESLQEEIDELVERKHQTNIRTQKEMEQENDEDEEINYINDEMMIPTQTETNMKISFTGTKTGAINQILIEEFPQLMKWRKKLSMHRRKSLLFDTRAWTKQFELLMEATWEAANVIRQRNNESLEISYDSDKKKLDDKLYHIFSMADHNWRNGDTIPLDQIATQESSIFPPNIDTYMHPKDSLNFGISQLLEQEKLEFDEEDSDISSNVVNSEPNSAAFVMPTEEVRTIPDLPFPPSTLLQTNNEINEADENHVSSHDNSQSSQEQSSSIEEESSTFTDNYKFGKQKGKRSKFNAAIPNEIIENRYLLLNIGGIEEAQGWYNVNPEKENIHYPKMKTHILRDMWNLYGIMNNTVSVIYSSHMLHHAPSGNGRVLQTLHEWHRVLRPGGLLLLSVPDLTTLTKLYLDNQMTSEERIVIMKLIYGPQRDANDFHYIGFNGELLVEHLQMTGFCSIQRVQSFNIGFQDKLEHPIVDTSDIEFKGNFISLNMVARVCPESKPTYPTDGFTIDHHSVPYVGDPLR